MERKEELRAAIRKLLDSARQSDAKEETVVKASLPFTHEKQDAFHDLQVCLSAHHIEAELSDITHAMLHALSTRPTLCRGLLAAYLMDK